MTLAELKKLDPQLRINIGDALEEAFGDPDHGLELTQEMERDLRKARKASHRSYVSLATIRRRLG